MQRGKERMKRARLGVGGKEQYRALAWIPPERALISLRKLEGGSRGC